MTDSHHKPRHNIDFFEMQNVNRTNVQVFKDTNYVNWKVKVKGGNIVACAESGKVTMRNLKYVLTVCWYIIVVSTGTQHQSICKATNKLKNDRKA